MTLYRIYLIDDDKFLLDMYAVKFKNAGHDIRVFEKGEVALDILRKKEAPDAILLDINMPTMTGFEVLKTIRDENLAQGTKIIMLTNQGLSEDYDNAKMYNVDGYIIKTASIPSEVYTATINAIEKKT